MTEIRNPIAVAEAIQMVVQNSKQGETELIPLALASGRFLAEDLIADHPIPFFDRSSFDGYAIKSEDTIYASSETPIYFKVVESIGAGQVPSAAIKASETVRIMTGAQIPEGADAVIGLELTKEVEREGETWIQVTVPMDKGTNVSYKGEDVKEGTVLAHKGRRISAGEMAMLATFGYADVKVYKQPLVGIFVTGTELLPVEAPLAAGKIRNSNSYMLTSQIENAGAIPKYYGILPDDFELCYEKVVQALAEVDFLVTTGGASIGDFDFVQDIVAKLGADVLFNKVAMRPGSVTTVATLKGKWIFGLSGNPAACYVGFELFARPVLRISSGASNVHLPRSKAIIKHDIKAENPFARFVRARAEIRGEQVYVSSVGTDKSGIASALIDANALLYIPPYTTKVNEGETVTIIWLDRFEEGTIYS